MKKQIRFFEEKLREIDEQSKTEVEMWKQKYYTIEQDTQAYIDKTLREVEIQFRERIEKEKSQHASMIENELFSAKNHIKDLEMRQILFFIEIERLYVVNGEFIEEINRITHEINQLLSENEQLHQKLTVSPLNLIDSSH